MTYEEKLNKIISHIKNERDLTRKGHKSKVIFNHTSFTKIGLDEVCKFLLKLRDDEQIIKITDRIYPVELADPLRMKEEDYFDYVAEVTIEVDEKFDEWYEGYLLQQKTAIQNLDYINILRIYDVVLDINERMQLTRKTIVYFRLIPPSIRYRVLFPADTVSVRHNYCQYRLHSLVYLKEQGVIILVILVKMSRGGIA